jgi:hypothetical protein
MQRIILKLKKMASQKGLCALCKKDLPERGAQLDRFNAMDSYTAKNTHSFAMNAIGAARPNADSREITILASLFNLLVQFR